MIGHPSASKGPIRHIHVLSFRYFGEGATVLGPMKDPATYLCDEIPGRGCG